MPAGGFCQKTSLPGRWVSVGHTHPQPTLDPRILLQCSDVRRDRTCTGVPSLLADIGSPHFSSSVCGLRAGQGVRQSAYGSTVGMLELLPGTLCFRDTGRPAEPLQGISLPSAAMRREFSSLFRPL